MLLLADENVPRVVVDGLRIAAHDVSWSQEIAPGIPDEDVLEAWNDCLRNMEAHRRSIEYVATEIPIGKPQVKFFARGDQWVPRGGVLRCQILSDGGIEPSLDEPFVAIDDRDFTLAEFMKMMGTHGGGGMRIAFVPNDELHVRPKLKVREPPRGKKK